MKIGRYAPDEWVKDHPTGNIAFQHLLKGDPDAPDNFMYILGRQDADFYMPRHRHNFDQIRLPIVGPMNHGDGIVLGEGQVGYLAEGLAYGPQEDPLGNAKPGERLQFVLQFGGASGIGFMSIEERRKAREELEKVGRFEENLYRHADGKAEWGLNTIWEHVYKAKLKYPKSRYRTPVIADPKNFNWLRMTDAAGVDHKFMGSFSERGVWVEMIRLQPGSSWMSIDARARRLLVVLSGSGKAGAEKVGLYDAVQADPRDQLSLTSEEGMELFLVGLPPIEAPAHGADSHDLAELPTAVGAL
ncbi:MAG: hypothetical protein JWO72_1517 [Caulobacteraceae bacterium]|nr:hypothetical protein [Caulobacteraceae bacterium]